MNYTTRDPRPVSRDPVPIKRGLPRDYIIKSLLALLAKAEKDCVHGETGVLVFYVAGQASYLREKTDITKKGAP